jgi:hypothetical protein
MSSRNAPVVILRVLTREVYGLYADLPTLGHVRIRGWLRPTRSLAPGSPPIVVEPLPREHVLPGRTSAVPRPRVLCRDQQHQMSDPNLMRRMTIWRDVAWYGLFAAHRMGALFAWIIRLFAGFGIDFGLTFGGGQRSPAHHRRRTDSQLVIAAATAGSHRRASRQRRRGALGRRSAATPRQH